MVSNLVSKLGLSVASLFLGVTTTFCSLPQKAYSAEAPIDEIISEKKGKEKPDKNEVERLRLEVEKLRLQLELQKKLENQKEMYGPLKVISKGEIKDTRTDLIWQQRDIQLPNYDGTFSTVRLQSKYHAAKSEVGGHRDWRVPTNIELKSLYTTLGMLKDYRSENKNDRRTVPFDWNFRAHWSIEQPEDIFCFMSGRSYCSYSPRDSSVAWPFTSGNPTARLVRYAQGSESAECGRCSGTGKNKTAGKKWSFCSYCYGRGRLILGPSKEEKKDKKQK
jgi:hypothetical protein